MLLSKDFQFLPPSNTIFSHHTVSPTEVKASPNTNALLPCTVTFAPSENKINESLIDASWMSNGSVVASFGGTTEDVKDGFSWDTSEFVNGTFSLTVLKASLSLQGAYECRVSYNSSELDSSNVTLSILGRSFITVPEV